MIEKAGKILQVDSRYALVQLTSHTRSRFFTKLYSLLSSNPLSTVNTVRARNTIYAHPNDTVIVGLPSQHFFSAPINHTNNCTRSTAIILRRTVPISDHY